MASRLYTIPHAAELLDVSEATVYRLIAAGDLEPTEAAPTGTQAPKTRVSDEAISKFIAARTRQAKRLRATG